MMGGGGKEGGRRGGEKILKNIHGHMSVRTVILNMIDPANITVTWPIQVTFTPYYVQVISYTARFVKNACVQMDITGTDICWKARSKRGICVFVEVNCM